MSDRSGEAPGDRAEAGIDIAYSCGVCPTLRRDREPIVDSDPLDHTE
jgi:hypothetical protein